MATKRNSIAKKAVDEMTGNVTFKFSDGRELTCDVSKIPAIIVPRVLGNGVSQKVGDSYAGADTVNDAYEDAAEMIDQLYAGKWAATRAAGEPRINLLVEALAAISGKELAVCKTVVGAMDDDQKKALRGDARIKQAILAIQKARVDAEVEKSEPAVDIGSLF